MGKVLTEPRTQAALEKYLGYVNYRLVIPVSTTTTSFNSIKHIQLNLREDAQNLADNVQLKLSEMSEFDDMNDSQERLGVGGGQPNASPNEYEMLQS